MELLKEIIKAFCFIAVLLSISEFLIPDSGFKKCIRFIIGILFIISVIKPFLSDGVSLNLNLIEEPDLSKLEDMQKELTDAIEDDYYSALEDEIKDALQKSGIKVVSVDIKTQSDEYNNTVISSVTVKVSDKEDTETAKEKTEEIIGLKDIEIYVKEK